MKKYGISEITLNKHLKKLHRKGYKCFMLNDGINADCSWSKEDEITFCKGAIITLFGFALYSITAIIYTKPPFDYYSKPNIWFVISIAITVYGFYWWIKAIKNKGGRKDE